MKQPFQLLCEKALHENNNELKKEIANYFCDHVIPFCFQFVNSTLKFEFGNVIGNFSGNNVNQMDSFHVMELAVEYFGNILSINIHDTINQRYIQMYETIRNILLPFIYRDHVQENFIHLYFESVPTQEQWMVMDACEKLFDDQCRTMKFEFIEFQETRVFFYLANAYRQSESDNEQEENK